MGLGSDSDGDAGRDGDMVAVLEEKNSSDSLHCSICLDVVAENGNRSWAKLRRGHHFHPDCIGSAIIAKGSMQCPNCRKIEKGLWLYGDGPGRQPLPDAMVEEYLLIYRSHAELASRANRHPSGSLNRVRPSSEESEITHPATPSSVSHPCPYIGYAGPIHHPLSSNSHGSVSETSSFGSRWNGPALPREMPSYGFPAQDRNYQAREQHSSPSFLSSNQANGAEQPSIPPISQISARVSSDAPRPGTSYFRNRSCGLRGGSLTTSSMVPPYPGSNAMSRDRDHAHTLQAYYHQAHTNSSISLPYPPFNSTNDRPNYQRAGPLVHDPSGQNFQEVDSGIRIGSFRQRQESERRSTHGQ